ncbi:MAG: B12-binding domain-containing protein [Desulfamplus sp.]
MVKDNQNPTENDIILEKTCDKIVAAILSADRKAANELLERFAQENSFDTAVTSVLEPSLERIGRMWETTAQVSLAQGYVAGKIAEDFMAKMVERYGESNLSDLDKDKHRINSRKIAVIGNIEDDYHALGRKLVGTFLTMAGWQVHDLGNDVPAEEFIQTAVETNARIIGASSMMYSAATNIAQIREKLEQQNLTNQIKLAVGGAVFRLRPELVNEVGGDGTAPNAVKAPALFDQLLNQLP